MQAKGTPKRIPNTRRDTGIRSTCEQCGKGFAPKRQTQGRFCSRDCYWAWWAEHYHPEKLVPALEPLFTSVATRPDRALPRLMIGDANRWAVALGAAAEPISRAFDPRLAAMLKAE